MICDARMMNDLKNKINDSQLYSLWKHLSKRRRKQFLLILILMVFASMAEVVSIGAVIPFLGVLAAPDKAYHHPIMQSVGDILNITSPEQFLLPLTIIFVLAALLAGSLRLFLLYAMTRLSFAVGADLSISIYRRTLYQEYETHVSRNSSEVINGILSKTNTVIGGVVTPALNLISSTVIIIAIVGVLFSINMGVALTASLGFSALYLGIVRYTKKQLQENSHVIAEKSTQMVKTLQEGLGGIRDVLIDGSQQFYCDLYRNADLPLRKASGNNVFIGQSPRYAMESAGMALIASVAYFMGLNQNGLAAVVPVLGALVLGAQRLLPALQLAYGSYSQLKGAHYSLQDVLSLLDQSYPEWATENNKSDIISFKREVSLDGLSYRYSAEDCNKCPWIIRNITLKILKGERIGFMGVTGSGKSTLIDIIMGLLSPTMGDVKVDGELVTRKNKRSWQSHIAHVPQNIYLADSSIEENIAFGVAKDKIDHRQVVKSAKQAQISELIDSWEEGYQTFVGERGIRLSGGQRQRIGIARALYKEADILVFDEATSALDDQTELAVMDEIDGLGKDLTILIVAHRLTTLKGCDRVVKLGKNNTVCVGSYQEIVNAQN